MKNQSLLTKIGAHDCLGYMTKEQALRYGHRNMPADLKKAGFVCTIFESDKEIHGGHWYRINYSK